jgi:hypothetical protein
VRVALILCVFIFFSLQTPAPCQEALVKIYTATPDGQRVGTGFLSSDRGQVITAYHVVEGATRIDIVTETRSFSDIRVDRISPTRDIAVLLILNSGVTPYFKLSATQPTTTDSLQIEGFPLGSPKQSFSARATTNAFLTSTELSNQNGRRLFNNAIDIIPLDMTIYSGMSGGPVLDKGQAIGILSGSYQEGGSIAWAIPCKYIGPELEVINRRPNEITSWPPLTLMSSAWNNLRGMVHRNATAAAVYDEYIDQVELLAKTDNDAFRQAQATSQVITAMRPFIEKVANDQSLSDPDANRLLESPGRTIVGSLEQSSESMNLMITQGQQVVIEATKLWTWIADQSNVDEHTGWELVNKMHAIRDEHKDMLNGLDAYLAIDRPALLKSEPDLEVELSHSANPADKARALLKYLDVWQPAVQAYGSYRALAFLTTSIDMFRQIGQLMEPIVYQVDIKH